MNALNFLFGQSGSLRRGLLLNVIAALSLCIVLAGVVFISEFYEHLQENLEDAMIDEAKEIIGQIDPTVSSYGFDAGSLRFRGVEGIYRYTLYNQTGEAIVGGEASDAIWRQIRQIKLGDPQSISLLGDRQGVGLKALIMDQEIGVLVSTFPQSKNETNFNKLLHEIEEQVWWVFLGILLVLISALFATKRALFPLNTLSDQANEIGPSMAYQRLDTDQVPSEICPLIENVNMAFDRLEQGYKSQRDFSSNVAHEIRTPIAVLKSSIDRISDPQLKQALSQDLEPLGRTFSQLIDLARADAALKMNFTTIDLRSTAVGVATDLTQAALREGHRLSVIGAETVPVNGNEGLLTIALSNVIRNALQYTPENSEVVIELLSNPAGWRVLDRGPGVTDDLKVDLFERFNRGVHSNSNAQGAGIGLAIVKSVAESHKATVSIRDRDGGGSAVLFIFNGSL